MAVNENWYMAPVVKLEINFRILLKMMIHHKRELKVLYCQHYSYIAYIQELEEQMLEMTILRLSNQHFIVQ